MLEAYLEHLNRVNKKLLREGINLHLNLDVDSVHIYEEVTILEQFLYFNKVLLVSDSSYHVKNILNFEETTLDDFLRNKLFSEYELEWSNRLSELTSQPDDAGMLNKPFEIVSDLEVKVFTDSLNLDQSRGISRDFEFDDEGDSESSGDGYNINDSENYIGGTKNSENQGVSRSKMLFEFDDDEDDLEDFDDDEDFDDYYFDSDEGESDFDDDDNEDDEDYSEDEDFGDYSDDNEEDDDEDYSEDDEDYSEDEDNDFGDYSEEDEDFGDYSEDEDDDDFGDYSEEGDEDFEEYSDDEEDDDDFGDYSEDDDFGDYSEDEDDDFVDYSDEEDDEDDSDFGDYLEDEDDDSDFGDYSEDEEDDEDFGDYSDDEDDSDFGDYSNEDDEDEDVYYDEYSDESIAFGGINPRDTDIINREGNISNVTYRINKPRSEDIMADKLRDEVNKGISALFKKFKG